MNTRFVETFLMLAKVGNVRRVADILHTTPGTISMRVKALEKELGVVLFDWDHKTFRISADGTRLLRYAEALIETTQAFEQAVNPKNGISGRVRLGIVETVVQTCMPDLMKSLATQLPDIQIDLRVDSTVHLADQLMQREIDVILRVAGDKGNPYIVTDDLLEIPMHWIAKKGLIPSRDPLRKTFDKQIMTLMRGTLPYEAVLSHFRALASRQGLVADDLRVTGCPSLAALVSLVREGVVVGIMPGLIVSEFIEREELSLLQIPQPDPLRISMCYPRHYVSTVEKVVQVINKSVKAYCHRHGEQWIRCVEPTTKSRQRLSSTRSASSSTEKP